MEYTKGDWKQVVVKSKRTGIQGTNIYSEEGTGVIAHVYNTNRPEQVGNANILAASKDMYEALKLAYDWCWQHTKAPNDEYDLLGLKLFHALAKAEGK